MKLLPNARLFAATSLVAALSLWAQSPGAWRRVANTTLRLPASLDDPAALPPTLADTGAFNDLIHLTPQAGVVPYDVNVAFWSDGAHKTRWFSLPDTNLVVGFEREAYWSFPPGMIWIKHFELELTNGVPGSARRIETRFLVRSASRAYGVTYRWDDSQTNATLVANEGLDEDIDIQDRGETQTQRWRYPSRAECLRCHSQTAGLALGFNTAQLNRESTYAGVTTNQIAALNAAGYFNTNVTGLHTLRALASATNTAWSLEYRVRSYLAANCAQCHQPGTECLAVWDARLSTPTASAGIIQGRVVYPFRDQPGARVVVPGSTGSSIMLSRLATLDSAHMPPLATTVVNSEAIALLSEWITNSLANHQSFGDWQQVHFASTDLPAAVPGADPDGDGAVNELEYLSGTNPLLPGDAWNISIQPGTSSVQIAFVCPPNRACEVQWSTTLGATASWVPLDHPDNGPFFPATSRQATIVDLTAASATRFYRVRLYEP